MTVPTTLENDVKNLAVKSVIYGLGSILLKSINLLALPLYTFYLTPADYGIVSLATTLTALLSLIYALSLFSAVARFYFLYDKKLDRDRVAGTLTISIIISGLIMSILLDFFGKSFFYMIFPELAFSPYIRLAIWTAFFVLFSFVPLNLFQAQEKPKIFVIWTSITLVLTVALTILFVVFMRKGAYGYLLAPFIANALVAIPYLWSVRNDMTICFDLEIFRKALAFSLPLLPHNLASWVLGVSDRIILQFYVSLSALGIYSLGYTFGMIQMMVSAAITQAWIPFLFKRISEEGESAQKRLSKLVTYYVLTICFIALGLSLFSKELILILTNKAFHEAYTIVPIVVFAYLWNGLYIIPLNFLFLKMKTNWVFIGTLAGATFNIAINLFFVPIYGIVAAAWATFFAFLIQFLIIFGLANYFYKFQYEYKRIFLIILSTIAISLVSIFIGINIYYDILIKLMLLIVFIIFIIMIVLTDSDEVNYISSFFSRFKKGTS